MSLKTIWAKIIGRKEYGRPTQPDGEGMYQIDFDMMLKGFVYKRVYGVVRQMGVTVDGKTCLVTSGDKVDLETYEALLDAGVLREDYYHVRTEPSTGLPAPVDAEDVAAGKEGGDYRISA